MTDLDNQIAQWAAEDALLAATCAAESAYNALIVELTAIEGLVTAERRAAGNYDNCYLTDTNVDYENAIEAGYEYGTLIFWQQAHGSAASSAGDRAESEGLDLNALAGRTIY